jgi:alkanesulfonate monooxygenase SsuD/methylene tetrahydromethanopterin reductase-like flavin-dependent oxidoreductase (luciferase family)
VLGVGLGSHNHGELAPLGEVEDARERARLLDEGLERLQAYWSGEFEPRPVQRPRIPIWVAARWPSRPPLRRAARFDGLFPIDMDEPDQLAEMAEYVRSVRDPAAGPFEVVVTNPAGTDPAPWEAAGATWCLTGFGATPRESEVRAAIEAGPGA